MFKGKAVSYFILRKAGLEGSNVSLRGSGLRAQTLSLPAIPMSHPLHYDVALSRPQELPQKNSCKHPNPQGNVKYDTMAVEPESLPQEEWFETPSMKNCLSN